MRLITYRRDGDFLAPPRTRGNRERSSTASATPDEAEMGPERASRLRPFMKARLKLELTKSPCRTCARTPLSHAFLLPHRDERTHACTGTLGSVHSTTIFDVARAVVIGAGTTGSDSVGGDNNVNQNQLTTVQGAGVAQTMSVSPVSG